MPSSNSSSCPASAVGVRLTPAFQKDYALSDGRRGFRLRVEASDACGMDQYIFRYVVGAPDVTTGEPVAFFSGVCTWPETLDLPVSAPNIANPDRFRLDYFDIVVGSIEEARQVWDRIQSDVELLTAAIRHGEELLVASSVWIGEA